MSGFSEILAQCAKRTRILTSFSADSPGMQAATRCAMCQKSALWLFALVSMWGCGGSTFDGNEPSSGGSSGASGAAGAQSGGTNASGGTLASGGVHSTGGQLPESGGSAGASSGGNTSTGGVATGGTSSGGTASGGRASGGAVGSGGKISTGGIGGTASGGAGGSGGKFGTGGASAGAGGTGGIVVDPRCPARTPQTGSTCSVENLTCKYTYTTDCLCAPQGAYYCPQVDVVCPSASGGAGGFSAFVAPASTGGNGAGVAAPIPPNRSCTCTNGSWSCIVGP